MRGSPRNPDGRCGLAIAVALAALAAAPAPAQAQQRLITLAVPSRHVDPSRVAFNGANHPRELRVNVLLPDGYDDRREFPVLYLLHGVGDAYDTWARPTHGDLLEIARGFPAIVVMPEADRGFYTNWWNGGRRGDPGWERYYLRELIPFVEQRFRIPPGRRWRAVAGLSMGGMGSTLLASRLPGYFGAAATFSGFVSHQRPEVPPGLAVAGGVSYTDIFGPQDGFYATGHNPARLTGNLGATRVYVTVGDGTAEPGVQSSPGALTGGAAVELDLRLQAEDFVAAARDSGVDVTYRPQHGVHDWPYWRRHLREAIAWGLFEPVVETPARWTYATVSQTGEMWGLRFRFAAPPEVVQSFALDGTTLSGAGSGRVTILTPAGCELTAALPFRRELPSACAAAGRRAAIVGRVAPRRATACRRTRFRFRASTPLGPLSGVRVRFAGRNVRTGRRGRATMTARLCRPGRHVARFTRRGLRPGTATVVVRPARRARRTPRFTG